MINERTFVVDNLVVNQITPQVPGAALTIGGVVLPSVGRRVGSTLYASANGTTGFQPAATAAVKIMDQFLVPAGMLKAGDTLVLAALSTHAANTNVVTVGFNIGSVTAVGSTASGGTVVGSFAQIVTGGIAIIDAYTVIQVVAGNQQTFGFCTPGGTAVLAPTSVATTVDFTAAVMISLTMNCATTATDGTVNAWSISVV